MSSAVNNGTFPSTRTILKFNRELKFMIEFEEWSTNATTNKSILVAASPDGRHLICVGDSSQAWLFDVRGDIYNQIHTLNGRPLNILDWCCLQSFSTNFSSLLLWCHVIQQTSQQNLSFNVNSLQTSELFVCLDARLRKSGCVLPRWLSVGLSFHFTSNHFMGVFCFFFPLIFLPRYVSYA